ncbi:MAG: tetratricopeptide repeat protein, partial [Longimicrobiales bacterium]|nr:tetratricopeptide repeat protein [Longimicrobiales bacterium]
MISSRAAAGSIRRRVILRRMAVCLAVAWLLPSRIEGRILLDAPSLPSATEGASTAPQAAPPPLDPGGVIQAAAALAERGEVDRAGAILSDALDRWPDHPELLVELAGVRIRQGRFVEAETLVDRLIQVDPASDQSWELLAAIRYLQDDTRGALRAWHRGGALVVRDVEVRVLTHKGPRVSDAGTNPTRLTGIEEGGALTVGTLTRGERRLGDLPAARQSRLGYRALSRGEAALEGTVVLGPGNPFTWPGLTLHALRSIAGRFRIVSSDPLGELERWQLSGNIGGTVRSVEMALAHPAPLPSGVWRWVVDHQTGRYGSRGSQESVREERSGIAWSHSDWITGSLRGSGQARLDIRPGRGTFAGVGLGWTLLSLDGRGSIRADARGWTRVGGARGDDRIQEGADRFGRVSLDAALRPKDPPGMATLSGFALRAGVVA